MKVRAKARHFKGSDKKELLLTGMIMVFRVTYRLVVVVAAVMVAGGRDGLM